MMQFSKDIYIFIIIAIVIFPSAINAQATHSTGSNLDHYISKMDQYLALKLSMSDNLKGFIVVDNNSQAEIVPNDKNVFTLSANYRWLSLYVSAAPKFIRGNNDNDLKGESKTWSYSVGMTFNHWMQELSYEWVKGYYLRNTGDYITDWVKDVDPYIQFPDLVYKEFHGQTAYKFNKRFSLSALTSQTERQLKSAGTFMPVLSYNYYIVNDKTELTGQNSSQKSNNLELILSLGYLHTFVIQKQFYVAAGLASGGGIIFTKLLTRLPSGEIVNHYQNPIYRFECSAALGYNGKRFFAGTRGVGSAQAYNQSKSANVIVQDHFTYQIFAGYRFGSPKILKDVMDKADEKISNLLN